MADDRKKRYRFLKYSSDRSGFDNWAYDGKTFHKKWEYVKQTGLTLQPEEYDVPPPSTRPLGGADISGNLRTNWDTTSVPPVSAINIQYITAAGGIASVFGVDVVYVTGSNQAVDITANPQVSAGKPQQIMGIQCVGSNITLQDGSGLTLIAGQQFVMDSGAVITMFYNATDSTWHETSRGRVW